MAASTPANDALDIAKIRAQFPALASGFIFGDNAGGSQILGDAIDRLRDYLVNSNCQLGATYSVSALSTQRVLEGVRDVAALFNAKGPEEVTLGYTSSLLVENLARALEPDVQPGDELVITGEHEANAGPWKKLAARKGLTLKVWHPVPNNPENPYSVALRVDDLLPLITPRTRIVAFTACSNILGSIVPVQDVVAAVRRVAKERGADRVQVSVDCVAYAPHRRMDVQAWVVDFCVFSLYKVYGPHAAALYIRASALPSLSSIAHHFLPTSAVSKLQLGGPGYELNWAATAIAPYLRSLTPAGTLEAAFDAVAAHEQTLVRPLLGYLRGKAARGVRIVGEEREGLGRVPTVSFVVVGEHPVRSKDIVDVFDRKGGIGIRYGHFYAYTLVDSLQPKLDIDDGVVRISFVHYNTVQEVERVIEVLEEALAT
ncbi:hypothetical protein PLICRDRAFT_58168 [Plicaturopsis crispa FD-325 SS-3]|uniref:Aminotransferase class V domain-containing protein n=1 Tax=Plicaturopsis crispa FD-325 SS-3 TaxID=944288 RepID=A0A0C9T370_PLICR|nr:hypothetical protein PLICRDRAFT_58168 [Plicaturopsis crispa FD-325 SS-3]